MPRTVELAGSGAGISDETEFTDELLVVVIPSSLTTSALLVGATVFFGRGVAVRRAFGAGFGGDSAAPVAKKVLTAALGR